MPRFVLCDRAAIPKLKLGFAAGLQPRIHLSAGMVPAEQLLCGGFVLPGIQLPQQTRLRQPPRAPG